MQKSNTPTIAEPVKIVCGIEPICHGAVEASRSGPGKKTTEQGLWYGIRGEAAHLNQRVERGSRVVQANMPGCAGNCGQVE
jgi:hypothetical protein